MKKLLLSLFMLIPLMAWADDSGITGECNWKFEESSGTLTFYGNGNTDRYYLGGEPWDAYRYSIKKIVAAEGVRGVGAGIFWLLPDLLTVELASTVTNVEGIWTGAEYVPFERCENIHTVYVNGLININLQQFLPDGASVVYGENGGFVQFYNEDDNYLNSSSNYINKAYMEEHDGKVTIPICFQKSDNLDICQVQFRLFCDNPFVIARDEDGELMVELDKPRFNYTEKKGYSHQLTVGEDLHPDWQNEYSFVISSSSNALISGEEGTLLNITFTINGDLENRGYRIFYLDPELSTPQAMAIHPRGLEKHVEVFVHTTKGDFDSDDEVTVVDYANLVNALAGFTDLGDWRRQYVCDVNEDENVSVADLAGIVNIILYGNWQGEESAGAKSRENAGASYDNNTSVGVEPFSIAPGETKEVEVNLSSLYNDLSQAQFDLVLPKGLSVVGMDGELDIMAGDLVASGKRGFSHTIASAQREDGTVRVLCLSDSNTPFTSNTGSIVRITVQADENLSGENCDLALSNIKLSHTDASKVNVAGVKANVKVKDSTTDINRIGNDGAQHVDIFSIDGVRTGKLNKGINIIRTADGKTRKILVK